MWFNRLQVYLLTCVFIHKLRVYDIILLMYQSICTYIYVCIICICETCIYIDSNNNEYVHVIHTTTYIILLPNIMIYTELRAENRTCILYTRGRPYGCNRRGPIRRRWIFGIRRNISITGTTQHNIILDS